MWNQHPRPGSETWNNHIEQATGAELVNIVAHVRCYAGIHPLIEKPNYLPSDMLSPCLLVVHDASTCGQHHVAELSARQELYYPFLQIAELDIVARRDDTSLIESTIELDNNLPVSVIINFFKFANVTCRNVSSQKRLTDNIEM